MAHGSHETEIKLAVPDVATAKRQLYRAGFRVHKRRVFEDNTVFDTPDQRLRSGRTLLRLREAGGKTILTYKGVPVEGKHKSREELEVEVSNAATARLIVDRLDFHPTFRYQKYRTEYKQPSSSGIATLDETPIGVYLELEGRPQWIDRSARRLGFAESDYINDSYGRLFLAWREKTRSRANDMVWTTTARGR
jgi:adenylate cyclase class 2